MGRNKHSLVSYSRVLEEINVDTKVLVWSCNVCPRSKATYIIVHAIDSMLIEIAATKDAIALF